MSHLDPSSLASYNSLSDPHLQSYFSNERIRSHLKQAGLISGQGEIIPDGEYRARLARREHTRHVRHMLAQNIVKRAIDMERSREAEMKRHYEMMTKAALVNNVKESRKRSGSLSGLLINANDIGLLSLDLSCSQSRPKSANLQNEMYNEQTVIPRLHSAKFSDNCHISDSSNTLNRRRSGRRRRISQRRKSSNINRSSSLQPPNSSNKHLNSLMSPPCKITMVYYGPHTKVDYDHSVFEQIDEVIVMQQHCGGENLIVYKNYLKPGDEFTFESRRRSDYSFGLSLYVKGLIDSRISTCCEYKHRHGVKLGGDRGHFAIKSVHGSKPCIRCQYEKEARLKRYAQSPKERDDESKMPITIPLPVSDEQKTKDNAVIIPVHHTSISNTNYSEDFDDSDTQKKVTKDGHSTDSSRRHSRTSEQYPDSKPATPKAPPRVLPPVHKQLSTKSDSDFESTTQAKSKTKTWHIIFHEQNIEKNVSEQTLNRLLQNSSLKISFIANDQNNETEIREFNMNEITKNYRSNKSSTFPIKLKNVGKPERIRLIIHTKDKDDTDDEEEQQSFKWYLGRIEVIDPEMQFHLTFPCDKWINPSEEKILRPSKDLPRPEQQQKSSRSSSRSSSNENNYQKHVITKRKSEIPNRSRSSSNSSKQSKSIQNSTRDNVINNRSSQNDETTSYDDLTDRERKIRYCVTIYPSHEKEGNFNPNESSQIYLFLNNHTKQTYLLNQSDKSCPKFEAGVEKEFSIDLVQHINEKPKTLKIGYINSNPEAEKWKLKKIVLINKKTNKKTTFPCHESLSRNEVNFRAERIFQSQSQDSSDENTPRSERLDYSNKPNGEQETKPTGKKRIDDDDDDDDDDDKHKSTDKKNRKSPTPEKMSDHGNHDNTIKKKNNERSSSFQSMSDNDAHYRKIFTKLDPKNELKLGSDESTPSTPRNHRKVSEKESTNHIVDPLDGLDGLTDPTPRSIDQLNPTSIPSRTTEESQHRFGNSRRTDRSDDDDN